MNADKFVVRGQTYDVLSPATFGDYIETVGAACINPLGYDENKLFLAYDDNVQKLFRATAAIAYSELLIKDTNCEPTTMAEALANALSAGGVSYDNTDSGLTASNVQGAIDEVNGDVETVNSDLLNFRNAELNVYGSKNVLENKLTSQIKNGVTFTVNGEGIVTVIVPSGHSTRTTVEINKYTVGYTPECLQKGNWILSGSDGEGAPLEVNVWDATNSQYIAQSFNGADSSPFTLGNVALYSIEIVVGSTQAAGTYKVKPMIRSALISDRTYVPYAKTNRELSKLGYKATIDSSYNASTDTNQFLKRCEVTFTTGPTAELITVYGEVNNSNAAALRIGLRNGVFTEKNNPDKANPWTYYPEASTICWAQLIGANTTKTIELWAQWSANANNCRAYLQVTRIAV